MRKMNPCLTCGIPLRLGALIVGWVEIVGYFLAICASLWAWGSVANCIMEDGLALRKALDSGNMTSTTNPQATLNEPDLNLTTAELFILTLNTIFFFLGLVMAIILVVGAKKGLAPLLQGWILVKAILITLTIIHLMVSPGFLPDDAGVSVYILDSIFLGLSLYFFLIVYAHHEQLRDSCAHHPTDGIAYEKAAI